MIQSTNPVISGFKPFDRQAINAISPGVVWGSVQYSNLIRGYQITKGEGDYHYANGELQEFDLANFNKLPAAVESSVRLSADKHESVMLYEYRHWEGNDKVLHGYIIADSKNTLIDAFAFKSPISINLIRRLITYVTDCMQEVGHEFQPTIILS